MTSFPGVAATLAQALTARGYTDLTPVQSEMLDPDLATADVLVSAQTGSGKTVAFGLALGPTLLGDADTLPRAEAPLALVIAPTRELALQVKRELSWLYAGTKARFASCVGGMDYRTERSELSNGAHIVVGTPGRLVDHMTRGSLDMSGLRAIVLDEADEMLDLGFRDDLETLLGSAPDERRTLMFSATVSKQIASLAKNYQRNAVRINTTTGEPQHVDIEYRTLVVAASDRENAIINTLRYYESPNAIVFCGTRANVNHLTSRLNNRGFSVVALSGELSQKERTHALQMMRDGRARVCVATDVAARGIDLPGLELVIHADLPKDTEGLLHRSGRTGRAGKKGVSVLIVPMSAKKRVERLVMGAQVKPIWATAPSADEVRQRDDERLLSDPSLTEASSDLDLETGRTLIEKFGADAVAAAFVRQHRGRRSAPEELHAVDLTRLKSEGPPRGDYAERSFDADRRDRPARGDGPRNAFSESIWISLSIGRNKNAEPRWLIPMLCKAGKIDKSDIGAIKMQDTTTLVQLNADMADKLLAHVTERGGLEQGIKVTVLDGPPAAAEAGADRPRGKRPFADKKPYTEKKPFAEKKPYAAKKPYTKRDDSEGMPRFDDWTPAGDAQSPPAKKPYVKRDRDGDAPPAKRSAKDKPAFSSKPFRADATAEAPAADGAFRRRKRPDGDDRPAYGKSAGPKKSFGDKPAAKGKFAPGGKPKSAIGKKPKSKRADS